MSTKLKTLGEEEKYRRVAKEILEQRLNRIMGKHIQLDDPGL
jgi:16S rRNA C1402 N4-methylase RsmH